MIVLWLCALVLCFSSCQAVDCPPEKQTASKKCCVFPFTYKGKVYTSCFQAGSNRPWCSLTPTYDGTWDFCGTAPDVSKLKPTMFESKPAPECEIAPLDIALVIDETRSIKLEDFKVMMDSIMSLVSMFDVGEDKTHIAIVSFAGSAQIRASLDDPKYYSNEGLRDLLEYMKENDRLGSPTRTDKALELVGKEVFNLNQGDRQETPNVMILLTDGGKNPKSKPYRDVLFPIEARGVRRVVVGIGKDIKQEELVTIAGPVYNVVHAKDFNDLNNQLHKIRQITCAKDDTGVTMMNLGTVTISRQGRDRGSHLQD